MYKLNGIGWTILLIVALIGCGSKESKTPEETAGVAAVEGGDETVGTANTDGTAGTGDTTTPGGTTVVVCGNKIKEAGEDCDEGNKDTANCKGTCEYWCTKNSDCEKTECAGASSTCDMTTHTCAKSASQQADGTTCGDNKNCQDGKCVTIACGNKYKETGEECDDGNDDDADGCTTKCKYTCVKGDKVRGCRNDCDLFSTECGDDHKCKAGQPAPDGAICLDGDGYCKSGRCIETECGDGKVTVNEQCDLGAKNDDKGACTKKCTKALCGDKVIAEKEECDDGNLANLDGCDSDCKVEIFYRATQFNISDLEPPEWCKYSKKNSPTLKVQEGGVHGNAFAQLIKGMKQTMETLNSSGLITDDLTAQAVSGTNQMMLYQLLDVEDPTLKKADPVITIGSIIGQADNTGLVDGGFFNQVENEKRLDWPAQVWKQHFDENLKPIAQFHAAVVVEGATGDFRTTEPTTMGFDIKEQVIDGGTIPGGQFYMRDIMLRIPVDEKRSKIKEPPASADWVLVPETSGGFSMAKTSIMADAAASTATGLICGGIDMAAMEKMPSPAPASLMGGLLQLDTIALMCPEQASKIKPCENGAAQLEAGDCSSMLDVLKVGCTGSGLIFLYPMGDPDVDSDKDGKGDAYSMVSKFAVQRVKMSQNGFVTTAPTMEPIKVE